MNIILASASPRRKELLSQIIDTFLIIPSDIDECMFSIEDVAYFKGKHVSKSHPNDLIISADTVVFIDDEVLGKPKDINDARRMLHFLSNKTHEVITHYVLLNKNKNIVIKRKVVSKVTFNDLNDELIEEYLKTGSCLDKAGGYGIQDKEFNLIAYIKGDENNIIGLPINDLKNDLINLGIKTK